MIPKQSVLQLSSQQGLNPIIVEKDYVLGWILAGISENNPFKKDWIFKGGTCLKKCYFKDYRFSEDLDFTLTKDASLDPRFIKLQLEKTSRWIYENTGIEIHEIILDAYPDSHQTFRGKLGYVGPLQQRGSFTRIKLDLTQNECLINPAIKLAISHPYGDRDHFPYRVLTYTYEELFAEKIRALLERARPRDLYDVIRLFESKEEYKLDEAILRQTIEMKLAFRNLPSLADSTCLTEGQENDLVQDWDNMLAHQINPLETPRVYLDKLPKIIKWLNLLPPPE